MAPEGDFILYCPNCEKNLPFTVITETGSPTIGDAQAALGIPGRTDPKDGSVLSQTSRQAANICEENFPHTHKIETGNISPA